MAHNKGKLLLLFVGLMAMMLSSCSVSRHLSEGEYLLDKVKVISEEDQDLASQLKSKVTTQPNARFLGLVRWPLRLYCLAGTKDNMVNRLLKDLGEEPRLYDESKVSRSRTLLHQTLVNQGYLHAKVDVDTLVNKNKVQLKYYVHPGHRYVISSVKYQVRDSAMLAIIEADSVNSPLKPGSSFDVNALSNERSRLTTLFHDNGYYSFKKEMITCVADTAANSLLVDLTIRLRSRSGSHSLKPYTINNVSYQLYPISHTYEDDYVFSDTLHQDGSTFLSEGELMLKPRVLRNASMLYPGDLYSASKVKDTHASYGRLVALRNTNINFTETSDSTLDCSIVSSPAKKVSVGLEGDVTYTEGGWGTSGALAFTDRNLFRGSEELTVKVRGAFEEISKLTDYDRTRYVEFGVDGGLNFPRFIAPFVSNELQRRSKATTQLNLQLNTQFRPEFDRNVFSASWGYLWTGTKRTKHHVDLVGINYVSVPRIAPSFRDEYLNKYNTKNSILKFNYEDLFIFRTGYNLNYTSPGVGVAKDYFDVTHSVRFGVETAGNLLNALSGVMHQRVDTLGQNCVFGIAYAQYVKNDFDWTVNMNFNRTNSLLFHVETGIAYPYGNTRMLPFEKRYYAGGANSVRGWRVRDLGPGSFKGRENTIDYINHSGDIKLECSMEYRTHLFWRFYGAFFVDAGNIWTIYDYDDQPGGLFRWNDFHKQIAVAYGLGLRADFNFVVLRADIGMKAINPMYAEGPLRYPIMHPNYRRDHAWHIAVGYPF